MAGLLPAPAINSNTHSITCYIYPPPATQETEWRSGVPYNKAGAAIKQPIARNCRVLEMIRASKPFHSPAREGNVSKNSFNSTVMHCVQTLIRSSLGRYELVL